MKMSDYIVSSCSSIAVLEIAGIRRNCGKYAVGYFESYLDSEGFYEIVDNLTRRCGLRLNPYEIETYIADLL